MMYVHSSEAIAEIYGLASQPDAEDAMHKITFFPLGNADSFRIDMASGLMVLVDYADVADTSKPDERRIDLAAALRQDLAKVNRDSFDVVVFTHLDDDHVCGAPAFFHFDHAKKYQGDGRIKIDELWVPAAAITDDTLLGDAKIVQAEARHRLKENQGIRVFSRPGLLHDWLKAHDLRIEDRQHLICDAGSVVPRFIKETDQIEFFVHSPFASREDGVLTDRNAHSIVLQATFVIGAGCDVRFMLGSDVDHEALTEIVQVTKRHENDDRLQWDIFKLPHHCSYLSLSPTQGIDKTLPAPDVAWLFEDQAAIGGIIVSTSRPIPTNDVDPQPPHRQAANYYRDRAKVMKGEFKVTMEHPTVQRPEPLVIIIDGQGARIEKRANASSSRIVSQPAPRVG